MGSKGPIASKCAATSQPMGVNLHKLGGLSRMGEDVCSLLLPFVCTGFYRLPVVCLPSQQFSRRADALSAISPVPGGDECERVLQGSSQPRYCPTFRNSKRCTCVTAWHKAVGSWCPETWRRSHGTKAQPCPADHAASRPVPSHRQGKAGQGMDTGPCPRAGMQTQGADNSRSYQTSCFYIVTP